MNNFKNFTFPLLNGILIINKPKDWTSFDVVKKVRGMLKAKKVGHTGTLDPMATGVLVLCIGKATKSVSKIMGMEKEYIAEVTFGATSNTDDADGEVTPYSAPEGEGREVGLGEIEQLLEQQFLGTIQQLPPNFSAKKIDGKRAYDLARQGKEIKLEPNEVVVHKVEILDYKWPKLILRVQCGKGFYMRSLARDLGEKLKVGAYLTKLERTRVGQYSIEQAIKIEEVDGSKLLSY